MKKTNNFKQIWTHSPSLFTKKTMYLLDHTKNGKNIILNSQPDSVKRRISCDNMHLTGNMRFTEENGFPILEPYNPECLDFDLFSYKDRNKHKEGKWAVHFFQDDYTFLKAITDNLETTTSALAKCDVVFAPDCSLYVDMPPFINKQNVYRSRFAAAHWQICGLNVIQTASWGDANSLKYCFEGLAEHSVTAVCGIGHDHCPQARHLWQYGLKELVAKKSPTKLIVYGGKQDSIPELGIPVVYIEDFITKRFRK